MISLIFLSVALGLSTCTNEVKIQVAHIQDASKSFIHEIQYMASLDGLVGTLNESGDNIDYALVSFTDKPQIVTGAGGNVGVWRHMPTNYSHDYCYHVESSLDDHSNVGKIAISGGKDPLENQLDALAMAAVDPDMSWIHKYDQRSVIRLALLVTDAAAHRNSPRDMEESNRNWYHEELMRGPCKYGDSSCTDNFGPGSSRSETTLSLNGVLDHYHHFIYGNDIEMLTHYELDGWTYTKQFEDFKYCCTDMYRRWPNSYYSDCEDFPSHKECAAVSCKQCTGCDHLCVDDPDFEVDWMKHVDAPRIQIQDYVYGIDRFDANIDCSTMEYPDPFSQEYADQFKVNNVTPVFYVRLPRKKPIMGPPKWPFGFEDLYISNNVCPVAGQRLAKYWLCYSDPTRRTKDGITAATNACDGYDPSELELDTFYFDCYQEHYGSIVKELKKKGVEAKLRIVDHDITRKEFLHALKAYVEKLVRNHPKCSARAARGRSGLRATFNKQNGSKINPDILSEENVGSLINDTSTSTTTSSTVDVFPAQFSKPGIAVASGATGFLAIAGGLGLMYIGKGKRVCISSEFEEEVDLAADVFHGDIEIDVNESLYV